MQNTNTSEPTSEKTNAWDNRDTQQKEVKNMNKANEEVKPESQNGGVSGSSDCSFSGSEQPANKPMTWEFSAVSLLGILERYGDLSARDVAKMIDQAARDNVLFESNSMRTLTADDLCCGYGFSIDSQQSVEEDDSRILVGVRP
jgi:hypothetical protein